MNMNQLRAMAKGYGLKIGRADKGEIIRRIQLAEGNFDCFGRAESGHCDQWGCLFRQDCLNRTAKDSVLPA